MKNRIEYIDIAKGIGILLIVLGHNHWIQNSHNKLLSIIFSFHVPLFFFLSGMLFNPNVPFKTLIARKSDSLLKPYCVTLLGLMPFYLFFNDTKAINYIIYIFCGYCPPFWIPLWFLPHLFLVFLFAWGIVKFLKADGTLTYAQPIILLAFFALGYLIIEYPLKIAIPAGKYIIPLPGLPFNSDLLLLTTSFFLTGFIFSRNARRIIVQPIFMLIALLCFILIHSYFNIEMDLYARRYDDPLLSTILAFLGIYIAISCSYYLGLLHSSIRGWITFLGKKTLIILLFHDVVQQNTYQILSDISPVFDAFNAFLSFAFGIGIPTVVDMVVRRTPIIDKFFFPVDIIRT